jgi:ribose transport system substrate-binding protein
MLATAIFLLVACGLLFAAPQSVSVLQKYTNADASGNPINSKLTIAFAQTDLNTPWRVSEMEHFKFWAQKLGIPHFIWNQANESVSTELSNVADLLAQKPDVLIVDPEASKPLTPVVQMAQKAGVPLVVADRALDVAPGVGTYQVFIGADQYKIGYQSTVWWIKKLQKVQGTDSPTANLVILEGGVGQDPAIERHNGVADAIKPYPKIKIVASQSGDWTRDGGRKVMQAWIQRFAPGQILGCFAASDEMMLGAQEALKAAQRTDLDGWFFTGDGQLEGLQAIIDGTNVADTQNPPFYGEASLRAAIAISQGVKFHAQTFVLDNETFTNMTPEELDKTKAYVAKIKLAGLSF